MPLLLLLLIAIPIFEVFFLLQMGSWIGLLPTVTGIVLTGVVGAWLARREGVKVLRQVQDALARGVLPNQGLVEGLLIFGGGLLLLTPGFFTDVVGFAMIIPLSRALIAGRAQGWLKTRVSSGSLGGSMGEPFAGASFSASPRAFSDSVVDGEIKR